MLTPEQTDALSAVDHRFVVWDLWDDYFYRWDTHKRCTEMMKELMAEGLIEKPVIGSGRLCRLTDAGRTVLKPVGAIRTSHARAPATEVERQE